MPHSSGGGSFHGGFHGGSSFHGSSSGVRSSGRSYYHSYRYFPGARRYVYYENGEPHSIYTDYDVKDRKRGDVLSAIIFFPFLLCFILMLFNSVIIPTKLKPNYDTKIVVEDNLGVLNDHEDQLIMALGEFYDRTGITPAIITASSSDITREGSLEAYAMSEYLDRFDDESHWLIVYTCNPDNPSNTWSWESVQGDNTDKVLNEKVFNTFGEKLQFCFEHSASYSPSFSFIIAHEEISPILMKPVINWPVILATLFLGAFIGICAYFVLGFDKNSRNLKKAVLARENAANLKCPGCGGTYVADTVTMCPYCQRVLSVPAAASYGAPKDKAHGDHVDHGTHVSTNRYGDDPVVERDFDEKEHKKTLWSFSKESVDDDNDNTLGSDYE